MSPAGNTINDTDAPPRLVTIRSGDVTYNQDFIEHLVQMEKNKLQLAGRPAMTASAEAAYRKDLARQIVIQGRPDLALSHSSNHQILIEKL